MYFGSDDKKALTKSIEDAFPSATRRLCTKHLKDNYNHYMQDKMGIRTKELQRLMDVVFGPEGLADADTSVLFEEKSTQVVDEMKDHPSLCNYFDK
jgi:transposase-like protein